MQALGRLAAGVVAGVVAALAVPAGAAEPLPEPVPQVVSVEHRSVSRALRLVFRLTAEPLFTLFTLDGPPRVVIDLPALDWAEGALPDDPVPGIAAIRHGLFRPGVARMVLELERPMAVRAAWTALEGGDAPFRLVLELEPTTAEAFAETAGWPEGARWQPGAAPAVEAEPGDVLIAIDPGHGGIDPGASAGGLVEKDLVLDFALTLAERIDAAPGLAAVLTRRDDRFVPLRARIRVAREAGAHALLSLHTDSLASGEADGASVYTLSARGTDSAADAFAERENRSDVLAGADLGGHDDAVTRLVIDLARRGTSAESIRLADKLLGAAGARVDLLETRPHRRGNFFVLKAPDLPSVLVELGFLSSPEDRDRLVDPAWREAMAEALVDGLLAWRETASPGFLAPRD